MAEYNYITIFHKSKREGRDKLFQRNVHRHIPPWRITEETLGPFARRSERTSYDYSIIPKGHYWFKVAGGVDHEGMVDSIILPPAFQSLSRSLRTVFPTKVLERIFKFLKGEANAIVGFAPSEYQRYGRGYPLFESDWYPKLDIKEMLARSQRIATDMIKFAPGGEEYYKLEASFKANQANMVLQKSKRLMKYTPPQPYKPPPSPKPPPSLSNLTALFKNLKLTDLEPRRGTKRRGVLTFPPRKK